MPKRARKVTLGVVTASALLFLTGCTAEDNEILRLAMPKPATKEAQSIFDLWMWGWLAAILTGILVWGLIIYAMIKFRRRSDDEIPVQVRYNLPIEILYTLAPVMMVLVFFFFTVKSQDDVLHAAADLNEANAAADVNVTVVGQQWSWTFNYTKGSEVLAEEPLHYVGTTAEKPVLWLVEDKSVSVNLVSPDVIHSFWVPAFLFKMDIVPGRDEENHFTFTPDKAGTYEGRCAELCGVYHSRMLFQVKVVSQAEFDQHMQELKDRGATGVILGGTDASTQAGLEGSNNGGEE